MTEAVRLVVWDLDETFWKGTIAEGGIAEYVQKHHDIVIELAKRGIMSSICSKNDPAVVLPILQEKGILEFFVFPSISWDPKGMRLAQLVDTVQLRAPTILFIDDNPNNRAEATAIVTGIQVEDETFTSRMLDDPRLKGKNDVELTRLRQYKLLEQKKVDEQSSAGSNEDFLRSCDVRALIEYNVEPHIDRVIELVNRTNQLNYTKRRFPDDPEKAREELRQQMRHFDCQVGLIRVADKYGDYGFVGFFLSLSNRVNLVENRSNTRLVHFCFSCRTLGMLVEKWVYDFLGQPELNVVGEVLTDLGAPKTVDWIRLVPAWEQAQSSLPKPVPHIVTYGGCEAHMIGVYLKSYTNTLETYGNYSAGPLFVRINQAAIALDICDREVPAYAPEAKILGVPLNIEASDFISEAPHETLFVFNLSADAASPPLLRHKCHGWLCNIYPRLLTGIDFVNTSDMELRYHLSQSQYSQEDRQHLLRIGAHLRENYEPAPGFSEVDKLQHTRDLIARIPRGSKMVIVINHHETRPEYPSEEIQAHPAIRRYEAAMRELAGEFPFVGIAAASEVVRGVHDMLEHDHYTRETYLRLAQRVAQVAEQLSARTDAPLSKHSLAAASFAQRQQAQKRKEARELVIEGYRALLRRDPDPSAESYVLRLIEGRYSPADFIRSIVSSSEFRNKWTAIHPSDQRGTPSIVNVAKANDATKAITCGSIPLLDQ